MPTPIRMDPPKFREKVLIGLEHATPSFDVRGKVVGPGGANLQYITNETGAIVTIRGKGSGYIEASGQESIEPLHICVEHSKYEVLQAGRQLAFNLIETVQQEWANIQHLEPQIQQQQQQQQQQQIQQQQQQPTQTPPQQQIPLQIHQQQIVNSTAPSNPPHSEIVNSNLTSVTVPVQYTQQSVGQMVSVPPPTIAVPPPTIHIPQQQQIQVSQSNGQNPQMPCLPNMGAMVTQQPGMTQEVPVTQGPTGQQAPHSFHIQSQTQQVFVSNQGALLQQPTLISQQQGALQQGVLPGSVIAQQPQIIHTSYPVQYMQASNGQMVQIAYPNIVRPDGTAVSGQPQQVMLVQYGQPPGVRPTGNIRAPPPQSQQIPQIVQIVNPQTGQIQHVIQQVQQPLQMHQVQLQHPVVGQGGNVIGQQLLMPIQAPIQFAPQHQQMIITQPPPQMQQQISGAACVQSMANISGQLQVSTSVASSSPTTVTSQQQVQVRLPQGQKRRFDGDQNQFQALPPQPPGPNQNQQNARKGVGDSPQRVNPQQAGQSQENPSTSDKNQFTQDEWRNELNTQQTDNQRGDFKPEQPKRGRPSHLDSANEVRVKTEKNYNFKQIQQQPFNGEQMAAQGMYQQQQQQQHMYPPPMSTPNSQPVQQQFVAPSHPPPQIYQQSPQAYNPYNNSWILPQ